MSAAAGDGVLATAVAARETAARDAHARLLARDTTLWPPPPEVTGAWLGWLAGLDRAEVHLRTIEPLVDALVSDGVRDVVLTGMGGSSLFPLVLAGVVPSVPGRPRLHVLDSTDPDAVARIEDGIDWSVAALIVASKSGTTVETLAHLDRLLPALTAACDDPSARVIAITDPGSPLEARAHAEGFRTVAGDPDVGGRYSALSPFGLLPAALLGVDLPALLARARAAADRWAADPWDDAGAGGPETRGTGPGGGPAHLATLMACGVDAGRDALHLVVDPRAGMLGAWIEQLVAESSGKDGTGVLPVVVRSVDEVVARDRAVVVTIGDVPGVDDLRAAGVPLVALPWEGADGLAVEVLRWMQAVPLACAQLGVDPFDQPDVAAAKAATAAALADGTEPPQPVALATLDSELAGAAYVAILAYGDPDGAQAAALADSVAPLARRLAVPVTLGIGPRYLHSTGQLHKGGRADGAYLVVVGEPATDREIPGRGFGFTRLLHAQAAGDVDALRAAGRRVAVVAGEELVALR